MAEKTFNSRIVHKHDTEANWLKATSFTPKQGEIIIYDVDASYSYERIKIGDGTRNVNDLPFYAGSWEDLSNKPFWSEGPTVVEWPGDTTGLSMSSDGTTYKVSSLKPSQSEILGGKLTFQNGSVIEITSDIVENYGYIISIYYNTIFINVSNGSTYNASLGVTLPEPGVYIQKNTYNQLLSFSYGEEVIYTLDEKYIPDTIARASDVEAANIVYVGPDEPTDPNIKVWINTAEEGTGVVPVLPRIATITLAASAWSGSSAPYSQTVNVNTATPATKIDLQPTVAQIVSLQNDDIALMAENTDGVITIYSFGGKPSSDMTMQAQLMEVSYV